MKIRLIFALLVFAISAPALGQEQEIDIDSLIADLTSGNSSVRMGAAQALGESGDERTLDPLIEALGDEEAMVRIAAGDGLSFLASNGIASGRAVEPLVQALNDQDANVRVNVAEALGDIKDPRAVDPLVYALNNDEDWGVRDQSVGSLGLIGDPRAIEPLIMALQDESETVRSSSALSLGRHFRDSRAVEPLIRALQEDDSPAVRWNAVDSLGMLEDKRAVEPLIQALNDDEESQVRVFAADALGKLRDVRAVQPLIDALGEDEDSVVRSNAARSLGLLGDARAVEPLILVLDEGDSFIRMAAAHSLGLLGDSRAIEPLKKALEDEDDEVKIWASYSMAKLGKTEYIDTIRAYLDLEDNYGVRWTAAIALGDLGDSRAVEPLIEVLQYAGGWDTRTNAAEALGKTGDPRARNPLLAAQKDESLDVRDAAAAALEELDLKEGLGQDGSSSKYEETRRETPDQALEKSKEMQDYGQITDESYDSKNAEIPPESLGSSTGSEHGDGLEIRGQAATGDFEWTTQNFAGFYYDPNEDVGTEVLTATLREEKLSGSQPFGLYYQTTVQRHDFAFADWGSYQVLGFLGEKHLAGYAQGTSSDSSYIFDRSGDKSALAGGQLLKILLDDDSLKTITNDMPLQLEDGYVLVIKEIDIDSRNVFLELYKDGTAVDRKVLTPSKDGASMADKTYYYKKDIGNLKDVIIIAVHFKNAFRGADQDLATVDGLWQLSETPVYVAEGAEYDKMTVQSVTDDAITMANQGAEITLGRNKDVSIMPGMRIRTADADALRYYIYREITDPGTYEIRSTVETAEYAAWTAAQFAGFYYDLDQDIGTERLTAEITDGELAQPDGIRYTTQASAVDFKFKDWGSYDVIGFLGEKRFAGYIDGSDSGKGLLFEKSSNKSALAKGQLLMVLLDDDSETTITSRSPLMLAEGYSLELKHIDPDDGRVYANLLKGDKLVKDYMFQPSKDDATISDKTCIFRNPSLGLVTIAVHFKNTFRGADQNLATIDGIWQISESPISVNRGTSFDKLTVSEVSDRSIVMNNIDRTITLSRDKNIALAGDIHLRTADTDSLKYYLVKEESPSGFSGIEGYAGASEDASLATSSNPMAPEVEKNLKEPVSTSDTTSASNSLDELIYSDDFSDINSGWSRASNRPDLDAWGYDDGRYHIIRKKPGQSWSSPPESPIFRDFAVEVEVNQEEGPDDNQYGLIFRRDASGNYYCFQISGAGNYRFDVNFDGKWREIVPDTWSSKINTGMDENVLRVVCSGERFIFYVNGAKIGEAQDSSIPSGRIGLVAGSLDDQRVHISFDNIKVWAL